jgi:hypothetical protein
VDEDRRRLAAARLHHPAAAAHGVEALTVASIMGT